MILTCDLWRSLKQVIDYSSLLTRPNHYNWWWYEKIIRCIIFFLLLLHLLNEFNKNKKNIFFLINCPKFKIDTNLSRDWCEIDFLCVNMVYTYCYCVISDILMDHMQITNLINFGLVLHNVVHKPISTTSILISREYIYIYI